jgi:hypothetical protein
MIHTAFLRHVAVSLLVSILSQRRKDLFGFDNISMGFKRVEHPNVSGARRFEPSSRTFLNGEQPYAWDLLQPRAKVSRHRGAELRRRYGRLGGTSLLSPG